MFFLLVSDLHFAGERSDLLEWEQMADEAASVLRQLWAVTVANENQGDDEPRADAVLFGGDSMDRGRWSGRQHFLEAVTMLEGKLGCPRTNMVVVPGNHDMLGVKYDPSPRRESTRLYIALPGPNPDQPNYWRDQETEDGLKKLAAPFQDYCELLSAPGNGFGHLTRVPGMEGMGTVCHVLHSNTDVRTVVVGLNNVWSYETEMPERSVLPIGWGQWRLARACALRLDRASGAEHALRVGLVHAPLTLLPESEEVHIEPEVQDDLNIVVSGHRHGLAKPVLAQWDEGDCLYIPVASAQKPYANPRCSFTWLVVDGDPARDSYTARVLPYARVHGFGGAGFRFCPQAAQSSGFSLRRKRTTRAATQSRSILEAKVDSATELIVAENLPLPSNVVGSRGAGRNTISKLPQRALVIAKDRDRLTSEAQRAVLRRLSSGRAAGLDALRIGLPPELRPFLWDAITQLKRANAVVVQDNICIYIGGG